MNELQTFLAGSRFIRRAGWFSIAQPGDGWLLFAKPGLEQERGCARRFETAPDFLFPDITAMRV